MTFEELAGDSVPADFQSPYTIVNYDPPNVTNVGSAWVHNLNSDSVREVEKSPAHLTWSQPDCCLKSISKSQHDGAKYNTSKYLMSLLMLDLIFT